MTQPVSKDQTGVVAQLVITPELFPRMGQLGKSFQRIRYHRLRFEIVAGWPSTVSGAYVAGFVRDATDPVNASNAASTLLASGGVATKFWQSTNVTVGTLPDLYYTSSDPEEARWASPGSFVIAIVGAPNMPATFEVFCHWDVSFYEPTYESAARNSGFTTALEHLYASKGNSYLSVRNGSDWKPADFQDFSPPLYEGAVLTVLSLRYASVQNSNLNLSGIFGFRSLKAASGRIYPIDDLGQRSTENFFDETYVLTKGEKVEIASPPNAQVSQWFASTLGRHVRSGLSNPRPGVCRSGRESESTSLESSLMPCTSGMDPTRTTPSSKGVTPALRPSENRSQQIPSLRRDQLLRLMEQLTEFLPPLKDESTTSSEDEYDRCEDLVSSVPPPEQE